MTLKLLLALGTVLVTNFAFAGAESSGGGNGVVCFDDPAVPVAIRAEGGNLSNRFIKNVVSVEAYDLYEARKKYGEAALIEYSSENTLERQYVTAMTLDGYITRVVEKLRQVVPQLAAEIEESEDRTPLIQILNQKFGLFKVDDVDPTTTYDTQRCVLATIAAHYDDNGTYFLHIDRRLFDHPSHSAQSKAVLMLHEATYMAARRQGHTTSKNTRELIGRMLLKKSGMSARQWIDFVQEQGFSGERKYFSAPGYLAYQSFNILIKYATVMQVDKYDLSESHRTATVKKVFAALGERCEPNNVVGCLKAIERIEKAGQGKSHSNLLKEAKSTLKKAYDGKIESTRRLLDNFYHDLILPNFQKLPYKTSEMSNEEVARRLYDASWAFIVSEIDRVGEINEQDADKNELYREMARQAARALDEGYDLSGNPSEQ